MNSGMQQQQHFREHFLRHYSKCIASLVLEITSFFPRIIAIVMYICVCRKMSQYLFFNDVVYVLP